MVLHKAKHVISANIAVRISNRVHQFTVLYYITRYKRPFSDSCFLVIVLPVKRSVTRHCLQMKAKVSGKEQKIFTDITTRLAIKYQT